MVRLDVNGIKLKSGNVVENWQGRRAVLNTKLEAIDEEGELKTPIKFVAKQGTGTEKSPLITLNRQPLPMWHSRNRK